MEPAPAPPSVAMLTKEASRPRCLPLRVETGTMALLAVLYSGNATA